MTPSYPQDEHKKKNDAGDGCIDRDMQYPPVHLQYSGQIIIIPHIYIYITIIIIRIMIIIIITII
jgi:hypothetical protein